MRLYHGTTAGVARLAITEGLRPRAETQRSNWEDCESRADSVYLTALYAGYFAFAASEEDHWGIVEIETDVLPCALLPDEDYMEQATRGGDAAAPGTMEEATAFWRTMLPDYASLWLDSVRGIGNCAHHGAIPPSAITRVAIYDPLTNPFVSMACADPSITLMNARIMGTKYSALTRWFFGDPVRADQVDPFSMAAPGRNDQVAKELSKTSGRTVLRGAGSVVTRH